MRTFLESFKLLLTEAQKYSLERLLAADLPYEEISAALAELLGERDDAQSEYRPVFEGQRLSYEEFSTFVRDILVDLGAAYAEARRTQRSLATILEKNESRVAELFAKAEDSLCRLNSG